MPPIAASSLALAGVRQLQNPVLVPFFLIVAACGGSSSKAVGNVVSVVSTAPADGAVRVATTTRVSATFGEALDGGLLASSWLQVSIASTPVPGDIAIDGADPRRLVFTPADPLSAGSTVTVALAAEIAAVSGHRLGAGRTWSFVTDPGAGGGGGNSGIVATPLRDLGGPGTRPSLKAITPVSAGGGWAVTWTDTGTTENAFLQADHTWSTTQVVQVEDGIDYPQVVADSAGHVVAVAGLNHDRYVRFAENRFDSGSLPRNAPRPGDLISSGDPLVVARGDIAPGRLVGLSYDPVSDSWSTHTNTGTTTIRVSGLVYPYGDRSFQTIDLETSGGGFGLVARFFDRNGMDLGHHDFGSAPGIAGVLASTSERTGDVCVVTGTETAAGLALRFFAYDPAAGWSAGEDVGVTSSHLGAAITVPSHIARDVSGSVVLATYDEDAESTAVFWREAGETAWRQHRLDSLVAIGGVAASADGFVVAGLKEGTDALKLAGKRAGAAYRWTEQLGGLELGAIRAGSLAAFASVHATDGRFLLVAQTLVNFRDIVIQTALLDLR